MDNSPTSEPQLVNVNTLMPVSVFRPMTSSHSPANSFSCASLSARTATRRAWLSYQLVDASQEDSRAVCALDLCRVAINLRVVMRGVQLLICG